MSRCLRSAAAALGVLGCLALPAGALADSGGAQSLTCTGLVSGGTYSSLTVPAGQACYLSNASVLGDATVQSTALLELDNNGTIGGNVLVNNLGSLFEDSGWTIGGTTVGNTAAELTLTGTVHNVLANGDDTLGIQSATVDGSIVSNRGVLGGAIVSSTIRGNVLVNGTGPGVSGLSSTWLIAGPQLSGDDQEIGGNLVLTSNQSEIITYYNHIHQSLICYGNNPPPYTNLPGLANTVDGKSMGQCATPNPPPAGAVGRARSALSAAGVLGVR